MRYQPWAAREEPLIVAYYDDNPDYTLRWPPKVFATEADRLVQRGEELGVDSDWHEEVVLLLQQAFMSQVPADDFARVARLSGEVTELDHYDLDDEPF